jgi:hypothetical protein
MRRAATWSPRIPASWCWRFRFICRGEITEADVWITTPKRWRSAPRWVRERWSPARCGELLVAVLVER